MGYWTALSEEKRRTDLNNIIHKWLVLLLTEHVFIKANEKNSTLP